MSAFIAHALEGAGGVTETDGVFIAFSGIDEMNKIGFFVVLTLRVVRD